MNHPTPDDSKNTNPSESTGTDKSAEDATRVAGAADPSGPSPAPVAHGAPPRGPRLRSLLAVAFLIIVALAIGMAVGPKLSAWIEAQSDTESTTSEGDTTWYISQMHPWIIQPEPGQCPICGMDLTPVDPDRFAGEISIDPVIVQNIGIRVAVADEGPIEQRFRTVGTVTLDENRLHDVVQRFRGWVTETHVGARFDTVAEGDPLFTVYAPDVFVAERDYLLLLESAGERGSDRQLVEAAKKKLELFGIPATEIARLEETKVAADTLVIPSPADGVVWMKHVNAGSEIAARTVAYQIADLSQVWVEATIYEQQLPFVRVGQSATIDLTYGSRRQLSGTVSMIYPVVDPKTREVRARFVFDNSDLALKPEMFATVNISDQLPGSFVRVPREAVIGTGSRNVAFISLGRGRFEPRDVKLGAIDFKGRAAVLEGIDAGETVVVSGQFLLDSESKMRESLAKVMRGTLAGDVAPPSNVDEATLVTIEADTKVALRDALTLYLDLQGALYGGEDTEAASLVGPIRATFERFIAAGRNSDLHFDHRVAAIKELETAIGELAGSNVAEIRVSFGELSVALREVLLAVGAPENSEGPWIGMRCGMAEGIRDDGVWFQIGNDPRNPYFGNASGMRSCAADSWGIPSLADGTSQAPDANPVNRPREEPPPLQDPHAGHTMPPATGSTELPEPALLAYQALGRALYSDDIVAARHAAKELRGALSAAGGRWTEVAAHSAAVESADDLDAARPPFGEIGIALRDAVKSGGWTTPGWRVHRCGMARGIAEKGVWLQKEGEEPDNPYFGFDHGMSNCVMESWTITKSGLEEVSE